MLQEDLEVEMSVCSSLVGLLVRMFLSRRARKDWDVSLTCSLFTCQCRKPSRQAVFELLLRVHDAFDVTIDCKSVLQLLKKSSPPIDGQVPWGTVWHKRCFC